MEKAKERHEGSKQHGKEGAEGKYTAYYVAIALLIAIDAFLFTYKPVSSTPFYSFLSNFHSAPKVAIYINAHNSTALVSTESCATDIIEDIVASRQYHRNASSIEFFVLNQSECFTNSQSLGVVSNYTQMPASDCINMSDSMPSIFINYSATNSTIVTSKKLIINGDAIFLRECGVAAALS
ncbi:MAG: hypothetical protein ACP5K5_03880 [Candidatus Micrarchaeia archaeon]